MCVCSVSYPACNAQAPYCHLWPVWLYYMFPHYLINGAISRKKLLNIKYVLIFSTTVVWNISHSRKHSARYYHRGTKAFIQSTRYCFQILIKLDFTRQIFEKYSNIKYHENPSSGSRVVPSGRRYRWTDLKKPIVDFRNSAKAPKNVTNCRYSGFVIITDPRDELTKAKFGSGVFCVCW